MVVLPILASLQPLLSWESLAQQTVLVLLSQVVACAIMDFSALCCEAHQRHAEMLVKEMGVECANTLAAPRVADTNEEVKMYKTSPELSKSDSTVCAWLQD